MGALIPTDPEKVMVIRHISSRITTLSVPFWRGGTLGIGGRATIVQTKNGKIAVFSPVALTPTVREIIIAKGGTVDYIIAPDIEHHIFLSQWYAAYPSAHVIAPHGLKERRQKAIDDKKGEHDKKDEVDDVKFSTIFTPENKKNISIDPEFDSEFDFEYVETHPNRELVFNFREEKTLIEADLIFNLPATEQFSKDDSSSWSRWIPGWGSAYGSAWTQKNMIYWIFSHGGNAHFNDSMRRINKWDFDRIIPCHGDVIETDGKSIFEKLMNWNLKGKSANESNTAENH